MRKLLVVVASAVAAFAAVALVAEHLERRARESLAAASPEKAIKQLGWSLALTLPPISSHERLYLRGLAHLDLGRPEAAVRDLTRGIEELRDDADERATYHHARGLARLALGQHSQAIADWEQALDADRSLCAVHDDRLRAALAVADDEFTVRAALGAFGSSCDLSAEIRQQASAAALRVAGRHRQAADFAAELETYAQLRKLSCGTLAPEVVEQKAHAHYLLAGQRLESGDAVEALEHLEAAHGLVASGDYSDQIYRVALGLAEGHVENGQADLVLRYFQKALEHAPARSRRALELRVRRLQREASCRLARSKLQKAQSYSAQVDWRVLEETNALVKQGSQSGYLSAWDRERLVEYWPRVVDMTESLMRANEYYKESMELADRGGCKDVRADALGLNASMMTRWIFKSDEVIALMGRLLESR